MILFTGKDKFQVSKDNHEKNGIFLFYDKLDPRAEKEGENRLRGSISGSLRREAHGNSPTALVAKALISCTRAYANSEYEIFGSLFVFINFIFSLYFAF